MTKRLLKAAMLTLAAVAFVASDAAAQTCRGLAKYSTAPFRLAANGTFDDNRMGYAASFSYGQRGFFGDLGVGGMSFDQLDGSAFSVALGGGYEVAVDKKQRVKLCPGASLGLLFGPNDILGSGTSYDETSFTFGGSVGAAVTRSKQMEVVPTAGLAFSIAKGRLEDGFGNAISDTETFALIDLGVGLVFNRVVSFRPAVDIPIGLENGEVGVSAVLGINFGGTR